MGQISALTAIVLIVLTTQSVNSAPTSNVNVTSERDFMTALYNKLSSYKNVSAWLYPPKNKDFVKSPLYERVNTLCQSKENRTQYYACAAVMDISDMIWKTKDADQIIRINNITLPTTLEDILKEDDLKVVAQFCQDFTEILVPTDFGKDLVQFVTDFVSNQNGNPLSCETICQNTAENQDSKDYYEVNPVCAIWRKGYAIYKLLQTGSPSDAVSEKVANTQPADDHKLGNNASDADDDVNQQIEGTSNKPKRKDSVANQPEVGSGKSPLLQSHPLVSSSTANVIAPALNVDSDKSGKPIIQENSTERKTNENVTDNKQSEPKVPSKIVTQKDGNKSSSSTPVSQISSSTLASAPAVPSIDNTNKDVPAPPNPNKVTTEKSSIVPKPTNEKSGTDAIKKPSNKKPTDATLGTKEQSQNEAPLDPDNAEYEDVQPPLDNDKKDEGIEDDSVMNSFDQSPKKVPSVQVTKEKLSGDDMEVDKVRIDGENATVNVAFNEDPGVINYFVCFLGILAICYLLFHNKKRLIAYVVEGRRPQTGRRRSSSTSYRKLENNYD